MSQDEEDERKESSEKEKESADNKQDMTKKVYGDYEILKAIGKGKFAVVYRAKRKSDGEIVALKRISVNTVDNKTREKCLKEVKLLQSLDHPNIIRYMDSFINENDLVIVFEWAAAGDLKRQLRKAQDKQTPFEERIIWKYFSQIADAIQHMHERRIMHRDLKPANIFLTLDGTVKLGDLGLSRELSENTIQAHSKVGTPLYMSPEVLRGDGYDFKSDIWSIGCLLYELAMLKSPFKSEGLNLYSLFQKISKGEYSPLPERYSEELRTLACSMISTNSEDRPEIADICAIASRMRAKYTDEYVKQRRESKQRERDAVAIARSETEDTGGEDKSVTSNASSKTAVRHKTNGRHRGAKDQNDEDDDAEEEKRIGGGSNNNNNNRGFMSDANREDPHESSYPSIQKNVPAHENNKNDSDDKHSSVNKYNDLMSNLKGDEYHPHADHKAGAAVVPDPGNRFSEQSLGHSMSSREINDMGGGHGKDKDRGKQKEKHRLESSHGSSSESISLPKTNLNSRGAEVGGVFSHHNDNKGSPPKQHNGFKNSYNDVSPSNGHSSHTPQHLNYNKQQNGHHRNHDNLGGNSYAIPLADQQDYSANTRKPEIKVHRRKKSASEMENHSGSRRGSATKQSSRLHTPPKNTTNGIFDDEDLSTASPMQVHGVPTSKTNAYLMSSVAMAQMEILYGKLTLLKFPIYLDENTPQQTGRGRGGGANVMQCRLTPLHFAGDLSSVLGRRAQLFPVSQFHTFVQVAEWLCQKSNGQVHETKSNFADNFTIDVYNDSPGSIAKQMLKMAQDAGVSAPALSEVTPTSLSNGHGDQACIFLNLLADVAIQKHCKKRAMVYPTDIIEDNGSSEIDAADEEDNAIEEESNMLDAHVIMEPDEDGWGEGGDSRLQMSMIMCGVDPAQWKEEAERVGPKLAAGQASYSKKNFTTWSSHVQLFQKHTDAILSYTLENLDDEEADRNSVPTLLHSVQRSVLEGISGIARAESMINNKQEFSDASIEYSKIKQELEQLEKVSIAGGKISIAISEKLAEVQEQAQEMAAKLAEKTGQTDDDGGGPIMNLKRAIKRIKEESSEMQMTTAMVQQQLMSCRIEQAALSRKKRGRGRKKKVGGGATYERRGRQEGNEDGEED